MQARWRDNLSLGSFVGIVEMIQPKPKLNHCDHVMHRTLVKISWNSWHVSGRLNNHQWVNLHHLFTNVWRHPGIVFQSMMYRWLPSLSVLFTASSPELSSNELTFQSPQYGQAMWSGYYPSLLADSRQPMVWYMRWVRYSSFFFSVWFHLNVEMNHKRIIFGPCRYSFWIGIEQGMHNNCFQIWIASTCQMKGKVSFIVYHICTSGYFLKTERIILAFWCQHAKCNGAMLFTA